MPAAVDGSYWLSPKTMWRPEVYAKAPTAPAEAAADAHYEYGCQRNRIEARLEIGARSGLQGMPRRAQHLMNDGRRFNRSHRRLRLSLQRLHLLLCIRGTRRRNFRRSTCAEPPARLRRYATAAQRRPCPSLDLQPGRPRPPAGRLSNQSPVFAAEATEPRMKWRAMEPSARPHQEARGSKRDSAAGANDKGALRQ